MQRHIIDKSDNLVIRSTQENDLEFITNAEREEESLIVMSILEMEYYKHIS